MSLKRGDGGQELAALLRALHPEPQRAAERYEEVRDWLRRFFVWRGSAWPDERADETIDRVARRLAAGETIQSPDVNRYFLGVARNVLREAWRQERRRGHQQDLESVAYRLRAADPEAELDESARVECLERCLAELDADSRALVQRYYEGRGVPRIEARRVMADQLGVSQPTLRLRMHRLRARLEACVRHCLAAGSRK